jgi:trans-aconitate methyltransferase
MSDTPRTCFPYLHGFDSSEQDRLYRQAEFMEQAVYRDIDFSDRTHILEVGCGVGAQTAILLRRFPRLKITGIDASDDQLARAREYLASLPYAQGRYEILKMDARLCSSKAKPSMARFCVGFLNTFLSPNRF